MALPIDLTAKSVDPNDKWRLLILVNDKWKFAGSFTSYKDAWTSGKLRMSLYPEIKKIKVEK